MNNYIHKGPWQKIPWSSLSGKVNSVITSPPFNTSFKYEGYADTSPRGEYLSMFEELGDTVDCVGSDDCAIWIQFDPNILDPALPYEAITRMKGWTLRNQICWVRSGTFPQLDGSEASFGHYRPLNSPDRLHSCWGTVFMLVKKKIALDKLALGVPYKDQSNAARWENSSGLRCRGNLWVCPMETKNKTEHPCPFPVKLVENCLKLQGLKDGIVFDPFAGAGSTGVAAKNLGLNYILSDISPVYYEMMKTRLG